MQGLLLLFAACSTYLLGGYLTKHVDDDAMESTRSVTKRHKISYSLIT